MNALLQIDGLTKAFGPVEVLKGVSLSLDLGETLALTGESGSGKSTLMHLVAALDTAESGSIRLDGVAISGLDDAARAALRRDRIGLVFQQFNLIPSLTVAQNIAFQARLSGRHDPTRCAMLAERLGIDGLAQRYPEEVSGGQQQRVAIARALANRPDLILADEPTGNLDEATGDAVLDLLLDLVAETGAALMMVTHSSRLAARLDRRLHLSRGQLSTVPQAA
jgi:putative ABC transport system ATP-binding protein